MATMNSQRIKSLVKAGKPGRYAAGNGLYLRISAEGTPTWVIRYTINKKRRELTLDKYPTLGLADAHSQTLQIKQDIRNKIDPIAERRRAEIGVFQTVNDLAEDWLEDCAKRLKYPRIPKRVYTKEIKPLIGDLSIDKVTPRDIRAIISKIAKSGRPTIANDALTYSKQLFRHGIKLDLLTYNPAEPFNVSDAGGIEKSRTRALSYKELKSVFASFQENLSQFKRENYLATALLLCLGVRKGELIAARWEEFDFQEGLWNIPKNRSKTGAPITVPLPGQVIGWLNELKVRAYGSNFVFPTRRASKSKHMSLDTLNAAISKLFKENKLKVDHFTIHDLRRTFRSLLSSEGVPGHVAERCLNHKLKGVEGIYDRYDYLDERRDAISRVVKKLAPIIN